MKYLPRRRQKIPLRLLLLLAVTLLTPIGAWLLGRYERQDHYRGGTFRIGLDHNPPNYDWAEPVGPQGFAVDVLNEAARRAGVHLQWVLCTGSSRAALANGEIDLWPEAYYRPGEYPELHQTRPWTEDQHAFVWDRARFAEEPGSWDGRRLALIDRLSTRNLAARRFPGMGIELAPTRREVIAAMCQARADVAFVDMRSVEEALLMRPEPCEGKSLTVKPMPALTDPMSVFARREMGPLAELLRDRIDDMLADGTVLRFADQWFSFSSSDVRSVLRLQERTRQLRWVGVLCALMAVAIGLLMWLIRKLRLARAAAERGRRMQADFLANVSHEVRTPMNGVLGTADLLLETVRDPELRGHLETIREASQSQLELLNQILDQSKIDSGLFLLEIRSVSPRRIMAQLEKTFHSAVRRKGIWLRVEWGEGIPAMVKADGMRVRQVLTNLLNNAIKFTSEGGVTVSVSARVDGGMAELTFEVRDTGIGIPEEMRGVIFERFRQVDASTTRRFGGTGLGLSIARQVARLMDGDITVESEPGQGSCFCFRIPVPVASLAATVGGVDAAGPILDGMLVLLVEDNEVNQRVARAMLTRLGATVVVAGNGREAVAHCRETEFDAVLMDCHMPEMDGYEATEAIRALGRDIHIVAFTAGVTGQERAKALAAGMNAFLSKPVNREELALALLPAARRRSRTADPSP